MNKELRKYIETLTEEIKNSSCCNRTEFTVLNNVKKALIETLVIKEDKRLREIINEYQKKIDNNEVIFAEEVCEEVAHLFTSDPTYVQKLEFENNNMHSFLLKLGYSKTQLSDLCNCSTQPEAKAIYDKDKQ